MASRALKVLWGWYRIYKPLKCLPVELSHVKIKNRAAMKQLKELWGGTQEQFEAKMKAGRDI